MLHARRNYNNQNMRNLFIIQSPFQLISAMEGAHYFSDDENSLIVCYGVEERNNEQIRLALQYFTWSEIVELHPSKFPLWPSFQLILEVKRRIRLGYKPERIFIGEFRSQYMMQCLRVMKPQESYLLDDGNITIEIQEKYLKEGRPYVSSGFRGRVSKWLVERLTGKVRSMDMPIHLFTCFNLQPVNDRQRVIKHSFEHAKSLAVKKEVDQLTIFFFGGNLSGLDLLTTDRELALISKAQEYYKKQGLRMVYIPHRREPEGKIKRIRDELGLEVLQFTNPAELEIFNLSTLPYGIASFFSTVLFTLPRISPFSVVQAFRIPIDELPARYRSEIALTYQEYAKTMQVTEIA